MSNMNSDGLPEVVTPATPYVEAEPTGPASAVLAPGSDFPTDAQDPAVSSRKPPKELGVMLVSAGVVGFVLPGPGVPALVAGGLILWPEGFAKVEGWLRRRFPAAHRKSMAQIDRFLSDLERRYPGSTGTG
jgi:hypothetical protein